MRYLIALGTAILIVAMTVAVSASLHAAAAAAGRAQGWRIQAGEPGARLIYFAFLVIIGLSFAISTMLWVFGKIAAREAAYAAPAHLAAVPAPGSARRRRHIR